MGISDKKEPDENKARASTSRKTDDQKPNKSTLLEFKGDAPNYYLIKSQLRNALGSEDNRLLLRHPAQVNFFCDVADQKSQMSECLQKHIDEELTMYLYILVYGWVNILSFLRGVEKIF